MPEVQDIDESIKKIQIKIKELEIRNDKLDRDSDDLLSGLKVSSEQLTCFIKNKENFTEKNWELLQTQKNEIEQKLDTELKSMRNPLKTKQSLKERNIGHHWLFVR